MKKTIKQLLLKAAASLTSICIIGVGAYGQASAIDLPSSMKNITSGVNSITSSINSFKNALSPAQAVYNTIHNNIKITVAEYTNMLNGINDFNKIINGSITTGKDITDAQYKQCQKDLGNINYKVLAGASFDQYKNLINSLDTTYLYYTKLKYQSEISKALTGIKQVKLYRVMGITKIGPYTAPKWMGSFITMAANIQESLKDLNSIKLDNIKSVITTFSHMASQINAQAAFSSATLEDLANIAHNFNFLIKANDFANQAKAATKK